jgi:hypothetical protein
MRGAFLNEQATMRNVFGQNASQLRSEFHAFIMAFTAMRENKG